LICLISCGVVGVKKRAIFLYSGLRAETAKSTLGGLATGRKVKETGEGYQLRDPSGPYGDHFGLERNDTEPKKPVFGMRIWYN
jgi:hypothetical protein